MIEIKTSFRNWHQTNHHPGTIKKKKKYQLCYDNITILTTITQPFLRKRKNEPLILKTLQAVLGGRSVSAVDSAASRSANCQRTGKLPHYSPRHRSSHCLASVSHIKARHATAHHSRTEHVASRSNTPSHGITRHITSHHGEGNQSTSLHITVRYSTSPYCVTRRITSHHGEGNQSTSLHIIVRHSTSSYHVTRRNTSRRKTSLHGTPYAPKLPLQTTLLYFVAIQCVHTDATADAFALTYAGVRAI